MTREEAIIILDCERPYGNCGCGASIEEIEDALNMAIKALEQEPCDDAIDRAEAMTEIMMFAGNVKPDEEDVYIKVSYAVQLLRELPPVNLQEPKYCDHDICISRDEVLKQINCWIGSGEYRYTNATDYLNKRIKALSSVTPKPKTEVLDKIRAEIEQEYTKFRNKSDIWNERACGLGTALEIIDKYKAESEEKYDKRRSVGTRKGSERVLQR